MMSFELMMTSPIVHRLGWALIHFLWQGLAIAAFSALALWLLRNRLPSARYAVAWTALLLMTMAVPLTVFLMSAPPVPLAKVEAGHSTDPLDVSPQPLDAEPLELGPHVQSTAVLPPTDPLEDVAASSPTMVTETSETNTAEKTGTTGWWRTAAPWVVCGWLVGTLLLSVWHLGGWMVIRRLRRLGVQPVPAEVVPLVARLSKRLGVRQAVEVFESALVTVPMVIGWLRPTILLPACILAELSPAQLEMILAHELAHIRRHDFLLNLLQTVIETLLFYHPVVWWISRRIRAEREACCDDIAVAACGDRLLYARTLSRVVELHECPPRHLDTNIAVAASGGSLLARIRRLMGLPVEPGCQPRVWLGAGLTTLGAVALLVTCLACAGELPEKPSLVRAEMTWYEAPDGKAIEGGRKRVIADTSTSENVVGESEKPASRRQSVEGDDQIARLIEQLGDDDFARREAAQGELIRIGRPARAALQAALGHADLEIAARAKRCLAEIDRQIGKLRAEMERKTAELRAKHRRLAAEALERSDRAAATRHYRALLEVPQPQLRDCRAASKFFDAGRDFELMAMAMEATAKEMKRVIHTPVRQFIRPAPPPMNPDREMRGPTVLVQTQLDGEWVNGKGSGDNWIDWLTRRQDDMKQDRLSLLLKLGRLYRDTLGRPEKAVAALTEAMYDVEFFTDPIDKVIARDWPIRSGKHKEIHGPAGGSYFSTLHELSGMQQQAGDLNGAIETKTRQLLVHFIVDWRYRQKVSNRTAHELASLLQKLPANAPLPPLFWINVLGPENRAITLDLQANSPLEVHDLNVLARPGYVFDSLEVTADMEGLGDRRGEVNCYMVTDKHTTLGRLIWHPDGRKGREQITEKFKVPPKANLIRFKAQPWQSEGLRVHRVTVKATFRPKSVEPAVEAAAESAAEAAAKAAARSREAKLKSAAQSAAEAAAEAAAEKAKRAGDANGAAAAASKGSYVTGRVLKLPGGKTAAAVSVGLWHSGDGKTWSARTDKLGRYSFQGVPASRYEYVLRVGNLPTGVWSEGTSVAVGEGDVGAGDLYLSRPQSVSGVVRDVATREPVAGVGINFSTTDAKGNRAAVSTDAQGRFRLYVVPRQLKLHCEGTADRYYPETKGKTVAVNAGQRLDDVDFVVLSAAAFSGRILLPDGKPAGNLDVHGHVNWSWGSVQDQQRIAEARKRKAKRQPPPDEGKLRPFAGREERSMGPGFGQGFRLKTDTEGRFQGYLRQPWRLADRDAVVDIRIHARLADRSLAGVKVVETTTIDPPPGPVELKLVPTGAAVFTVVNPDGQPVADARPSTNTAPPQAQPRFEVLGKGRYRATGLIPGWGYGISATAEGYRCRSGLSAMVKPGDTLDAGTLRLDWWGKKAVPGLIKNLSSKDRYVQQGACRDLGKLGPDAAEAVPTLIHLLNDDPMNTVRFSAAEALGAIGPAAKGAVPDLTRALRHDKHGVPREAAKALGLLGPAGKAAVPDLMHALREHRELNVRLNAAGSLGLLGDPVALPALKGALMDGHYLVREAALKELARPVFRSAEPGVATLLRLAPLSRETEAMALALRATQAGDAEGIALVILQARSGHAKPESALRVLKALTGQRFANHEEVLAWWWRFPLSQPAAGPADRGTAPLKTLWARLAEPIGPDTYQAILLMAARGDGAVPFIAGRVKPASAEATRIKSLIAELDHDEYAVRRRALVELFRLGRAAEPYLRTALGSGPSFESRTSLEQLLEACAKPYPALPEARRTARAIRVLELIGTDEAVAVLGDLAKGIPKAPATGQAQAALRRMGRSQQGPPKTAGANTQAAFGPVIERTINGPRRTGLVGFGMRVAPVTVACQGV